VLLVGCMKSDEKDDATPLSKLTYSSCYLLGTLASLLNVNKIAFLPSTLLLFKNPRTVKRMFMKPRNIKFYEILWGNFNFG
jgi:hypothetical protein